jgi:hypothetical protein
MHQQASFLLPVIETNGASKEKKRKENNKQPKIKFFLINSLTASFGN